MKGSLKSGDLVVNKHLDKDKNKNDRIGVLISESDVHPDFWRVLFSGNLTTWCGLNLKKIATDKRDTKRAD